MYANFAASVSSLFVVLAWSRFGLLGFDFISFIFILDWLSWLWSGLVMARVSCSPCSFCLLGLGFGFSLIWLLFVVVVWLGSGSV